MIRFIHTADWQIGMKAAGIGAASQRVRDVRLEAIQKVISLGEDRGASLMLITGDIFEDNAVDRLLVRKVGELISTFKGQVFITPGNHDPLSPGSVWEHPVWEENINVTVPRENTPFELEDCILFPSPLKEKYSTRNPVAWVQAQGYKKIAIGLAHGNVEGLPNADLNYPIPVNAAQIAGLDYLGLGHWHSYAPYKDSQGNIRMAYSGTHETSKFGERDSGKALLVEIAKRGASPQVELLSTGCLSWFTLERSLAAPGGLQEVIEELNSINDPENSLIRLRLKGLLTTSDRKRLQTLREIISTRFLYGDLNIGGLSPAPEDDSWIEELPAGVLREAVELIRHQALQGTDKRQQAVATRALLELFEIKENQVL